MKANGEFSITEWDEKPLQDLPEPLRLNHGRVTRDHVGVLEGHEVMYYTLAYTDDGRSIFRGLGVFEGKVGATSGRFTVVETGEFKDGAVDVAFELRAFEDCMDIGVRVGSGSYQTAEHAKVSYRFTLG